MEECKMMSVKRENLIKELEEIKDKIKDLGINFSNLAMNEVEDVDDIDKFDDLREDLTDMMSSIIEVLHYE